MCSVPGVKSSVSHFSVFPDVAKRRKLTSGSLVSWRGRPIRAGKGVGGPMPGASDSDLFSSRRTWALLGAQET